METGCRIKIMLESNPLKSTNVIREIWRTVRSRDSNSQDFKSRVSNTRATACFHFKMALRKFKSPRAWAHSSRSNFGKLGLCGDPWGTPLQVEIGYSWAPVETPKGTSTQGTSPQGHFCASLTVGRGKVRGRRSAAAVPGAEQHRLVPDRARRHWRLASTRRATGILSPLGRFWHQESQRLS